MRTRRIKYKDTEYWVTIDNAINTQTQETGCVAYVSDYEPTGLHWGGIARDGEGRILLFHDELSALTNANMIKRSEIDSKVRMNNQ